jgi:hypothetical protein
LLTFQHAKLAFEDALVKSGMRYTIVRPTAFFKSLCGQIERVRKGKPFLLFGDGQLTACKPISDQDLGNYLAQCVSDPALHNRILPIGGPGPAITPLQQGEYLFSLLGQTPKYSHVPVKMMDAIIGALSVLGRLLPPLANKAELARIGRYYATESMLVWDQVQGQIGKLDTLAKMGAYLKAIQQADDRFTGRAIKNITDAVKVRAMDFDLPDIWMENPDLFLFKPYEEKLSMIRGLMQPITVEMVVQEINRYADSEFRYSDKSDEVAIEGMVREFGRTEEAKRRYLEGKG